MPGSEVSAGAIAGADAGAIAGEADGTTDVSLIIGLPRRVTMTSSPEATRSIQDPNPSRQASALTVTAAKWWSGEWS